MAEIKIKSYGKVNLSLDITGVREDGYHELKTIMQKISLYDEVTVRWVPKEQQNIDIKLSCNRVYLPTDSRNLAYKGAEIMAQRFGYKAGGGCIEIGIEKRLPVAAGLAGGSGNGAASIIALNRLWNLGLNTRELCQIGAELGADVPFCILIQNTGYGCALCCGTGTEIMPLPSKFKKAVLLVKPPFGVSTKEVYKGIDDCKINQRPDTEMLVEAIKRGNGRKVCKNMINILEEYTLNRYKDVKELKDKIQAETSAEKVLMTGSGPTVFGIFYNIKEARKACVQMRSQGYEAYWATML